MRRLGIVGALTVAFVLFSVGYLVRQNTLTAEQLCVALARMVASSSPTPGTADYRYYRAHPAKLVQARRRFLAQLPCAPPAGP